MATPEIRYDEFGMEILEAGQNGKPFALLDDEIRLPVIISALYLVGKESIKQPNGTLKDRYAIGLQYDSLRPLRYEDGEDTGRKHSWFNVTTYSFNDKSTLSVSGLLNAVGHSPTVITTPDFAREVLGKQVSARVKHRSYESEGKKRTIAEIEAFKPLLDKENFNECIDMWYPHRRAIKKYPGCMVLSYKMLRDGAKNNTPVVAFKVSAIVSAIPGTPATTIIAPPVITASGMTTIN
jgi:hypothetical protein